jgi:protein-S-isoprenylcysteine O-methyltransferase Ste14
MAETIIMVYLWQTNPELLIARSRFHKGTKRWDTMLLALLVPVLLTIFPVAALNDSRFHWSAVPWWLVILGYLVMLSGFWLATWACRVNPFAEPTVRMQTDRGHIVIDTGPYAFVRHPMYSASLLMFPGMALALGSYCALIPACAVCGILVLRTHWEGRTLQVGLDGYQDYTVRVQFKLIPHVW